ncbi:MAG: transglycosylase SLT domain-containing protein [Pyrinomonadaceae bacterium]
MAMIARSHVCFVGYALIAIALVGCGGQGQPRSRASSPSQASANSPAPAEDEPLAPLQYEAALPAVVREVLAKRFTGDLDQMIERRVIRAGVTYNRTHYFVDKGVQRGASYEYLKLFEDRINAVLKTGALRIHVVYIPMPRGMMLTALNEGRIDLAEGQFTITPELQALVDFGVPQRRDVKQIVVTAPGAPPVNVVEDLSNRQVFVRKSSSYYQSLLALNTRLESIGRPPVVITEMPESLEDDDLLEMVNAGLIQTIVVDDYLALFWKRVLPGLKVHADVTLRNGGELAVAFRKNSPLLAKAVADFTRRWGLGTAFGNMIRKRYLESTKFVKNATAPAERQKFDSMVALFRKYGAQYDLDYLLMGAQAYQESRLDHNARSRVGAIGVMQIMPATAAELGVGDIRGLEPNIHGGTKYIRWLINTYLEDEPMDQVNKMLFAFASYNAGPGRIRQLRRESARRGRDPNVWFGNVEQTASEHIGRETVDYVSNIFKYYIAYSLGVQELERREAARERVKSQR